MADLTNLILFLNVFKSLKRYRGLKESFYNKKNINLKLINILETLFIECQKSSIAIFIAATSALAISTADSNSVKSGENDLGGLKEWNTDMPLDADFP